jgi:glycosyltransferase involved in cell wall biosynthesis
MTMLDVSVIIATYNRPAMVREAIESVLTQRGASFELIVIDDGSQDGSDAIVEEFAHESRMRFECTQNHGPAAARNRGVEMAQGPLVAFLDSDDLWLPN